ncbi:MAG: hypothetical protein ACOYB1_18385 [Limnohabitans sp.]
MARELLLKEINELLSAPSQPIVESICQVLAMCSDAKKEDLLAYAPSEIDPLIKKLLDLNSDFFAQAEALQQPEIASALRNRLLRISMLAYVPLSPPATE